MKILHRRIDPVKDRDYVLESHCKINYECDTPWKRKMTYNDYRAEWFMLKGQISEFYNYLQETAKDNRTIAEIIEDENGKTLGYLWVPFFEDTESGFTFADVQDIYIEDKFRGVGIASYLLNYAEEKAKNNGARVIRSGTGCANLASIALHEKNGYYVYRYEFEKEL
ncbi:MAG: GNAT family N-acetyltransferase [Ruminococcaceae bacterium]|nr:GNAT family N-acetyltransferase [Oscillospiraceae bacterium]